MALSRYLRIALVVLFFESRCPANDFLSQVNVLEMSSVILAVALLLRVRETPRPGKQLSQIQIRNQPRLLTPSSARIVCLANGQPGVDGQRVYRGRFGGVSRL